MASATEALDGNTRTVDPVTLEVIRSALTAVVREMSVTLTRTAYSTIIRDVHDFSCVVFDAGGRLIAQAEGIPSFNGSMSFALDAVTSKFPVEAMRPGDVFMSNDPYFAEGSSFHKNDINIIMPVFFEDRLVMFSASKAHYLDIGGKNPGSYAPDAQNTYQEGLSLPPVKLYDAGVLNEAVIDIFLSNVRVPDIERGDLFAQLAAGKTAEQRATEIVRKYGIDVVDAAVGHLLDHAERMVRAAIERIPDGVYSTAGFHDGDGTTNEPIPICVDVTVRGSDIVVDVTGSAPQRASSGGNGHWHTTVACSREAVMFLTDTSMGTNEGSYRPIGVVAPPGCVFRPVSPAPTTTGTADLSVRLIELILRALAPVLPDDVIAGTFGTVSALTLAGTDDQGREFVHFSPYAGGWGARAQEDGNSAMVSLLSGDNYNIPCEVMETRFPALLADSYELREGSAGAGRRRGGWGVSYDYRTLVPLEMSVALDHYSFPPYGLFGGGEGEPSALAVDPGSDAERVLHQAAGVALPAGTVVSHRTAGGGGYGNPFERDAGAVADDVRNELLDPAAARELYGVALGADGEADEDETSRLRAARPDKP
ncbi:MAG: N-methylhydantoinase [Thermoleophilaceae bacterium]|jgi:N-methylhydantoinase B|nr:N-methylhydantoinase [Thermoleophilaceae bacterium]